MFDIFTGALGAQLFARGDGLRGIIDIYGDRQKPGAPVQRGLVSCIKAWLGRHKTIVLER